MPAGTILNGTLSVNNHVAYGKIKYTLKPQNFFSIDDNGVVKSLVVIDAETFLPNGIIELSVWFSVYSTFCLLSELEVGFCFSWFSIRNIVVYLSSIQVKSS